MPLPEGFDDFEHLQSTYRLVHNRLVREEFSDLEDDDNITVPRSSLRVACTIKDNDTASMINMRSLLFFMHLRQVAKVLEPCYGIPVGTYHETRKFKPQVRLLFREDLDQVEPDYRPLTGEITFRLMGETSESVGKTELTTLATKIKTEFTTNNGYRWHKGKVLCSYNDPEKGYKLQIFAYSKNDGKELITKVLDCQNHTPDWEKLTINENESPTSAYPTIPSSKTILGKSTRQPRKRPSGYVRFQYATCAIWGLTKPVCLVDRVYQFLDPLVSVD